MEVELEADEAALNCMASKDGSMGWLIAEEWGLLQSELLQVERVLKE